MKENDNGFAETPAAVRGSRGFRKIPEDIFDHRLSAAELGTLVLLHLLADFRTGYWHGSAAMLRTDCFFYTYEKRLTTQTAKRLLARLESKGLLKRPARAERSGSWTGYPVALVGALVTAGPHKGQRLMPDGSYQDASDVPYIALPLSILELTCSQQLGLVELGLWARLWREAKPSSGIVKFNNRDMLKWFGWTPPLDLEIAMESLEETEMLVWQKRGTENAVLLDGYRVRVGPYKGKILDAHATNTASADWSELAFRDAERPKKKAPAARKAAGAESKPSGKASATADEPGREPQRPQSNGNGRAEAASNGEEWPLPASWNDAVPAVEKWLRARGLRDENGFSVQWVAVDFVCFLMGRNGCSLSDSNVPVPEDLWKQVEQVFGESGLAARIAAAENGTCTRPNGKADGDNAAVKPNGKAARTGGLEHVGEIAQRVFKT